MLIRSVRLSQWLFLASVISLVLLIFSNIYFGRVIDSADVRYQALLQMQKSFVDLVVKEGRVLAGRETYSDLLEDRLDLVARMQNEQELLSSLFLTEREHVFGTLLTTSGENTRRYEEIRKTLPRLIENVRYIHAYHMSKLKTQLKKGEYVAAAGAGNEFTRGDQAGAPELDIINAALQVQNLLMDVVAIFYEMQVAARATEVELLFKQRMDSLYQAINLFDDFSLDAQDGLLVEELLLTGKHFGGSFGLLLKNEGKVALLAKKLDANQLQIATMFAEGADQLRQTRQSLIKRLKIVQNISMALLLVLACWLIYYGVRLSRAFARTVNEAGKISNDLTYRIPGQAGSYLEFETISTTLNTLAETAHGQVRALETMQRELGQRVQERTAELVHMNTRLKNEIADRIKADESRRDLEDRLIRAKKMEAVGTLAGGVAHDLNNILSGVVTYPELLLMDIEESDPLYLPLQSIKRSGERAAMIVQDLLTLARRGVAITEVIDFREIVMEYLQSGEFAGMQNNHPAVNVEIDLEESPCNVKGSRLHLQKAVMNIVINGMEAMPDGGTLTITSKSVYIDTVHSGYDMVNEGDYVCLSVTDTGVGMTQEVATQIFEPFFTQKRMGRRSGTGLGMAVVYSTIKDHGGYIDVQSAVGEGSTITLFLPLSSEERSELTTASDLRMLFGNGEHLLVVDDIFDQRQIASAMLKRLNYTVATAASGEEAVAYARNNEVDLVILDMIMPGGMDGLDTFLALKAVAPDIRVIIASGYSESDRVHRAQSMGAGRYIKKPYSLELLGQAIHDTLS